MSEQLQLEDEAISITLRRAWDRALRTLSGRVNKPTFEAHIRTLRPVSLTEVGGDEAGASSPSPLPVEITLGVPSAFTREWVEKRHAPLIAGILEEILDRDVHLRFALLPKETPVGAGAAAAAATTLAPPPAASAARQPVPDADATDAAPARGLFEAAADPVLAPRPAAAVTPPASPNRPRAGGSAPAPARANTGTRSGGAAEPHLVERYTFDNFVTGPSNRHAHAGAQAVAQAPGQAYNPLFLYGPSGLGKTHLMHAIGNHVAAQTGTGGANRVAYISGESFTTHFITSLRERRSEDFRRKWRSVDILLVDDIQFIASKEQTKEEFFHTFNALYQTGKQIVISSDRSPRELRTMDERLRSRFESGLIADIAPPNLETRVAILQKKAETERMRIPDDVLLYMARLVQSNIRTLEGALVKLIAYASLANSPVTTQLAADILERYYISAGADQEQGGVASEAEKAAREADMDAAANETPRPDNPRVRSALVLPKAALVEDASLFSEATPPAAPGLAPDSVTIDAVRRIVARRFNLPVDALAGQKRDRDANQARHVAMHLMRELTEVSLPGIGQLFGGRSHSTVRHACERIREQIPFDDDLKRLINDLVSELRSETAG